MTVHQISQEIADEFSATVARLRSVTLHPDIHYQEVPSPRNIAPYSFALSADLIHHDTDLASGRFVMLHDPAGQSTWEGTYRLVTFVRASLEHDVGSDPMVTNIGWAWLQECLEAAGATHHAIGGTVTAAVSESFGALAHRPGSVDVEIRASWTPDNDLDTHLNAWANLLCTVGGLPPLPPGVTSLHGR